MDWRDKLDALKSELPEGEVQQSEGYGTNAAGDSAKGVVKKQQEPLRIELDKRKGKPSTLISGYMGSDDELKELARLLKVRCSAGGSSRDGEILIQGDFRKKTAEILTNLGYKVKRINF